MRNGNYGRLIFSFAFGFGVLITNYEFNCLDLTCRTQQEREQRRMEFQNQKEQIQSQIDFEITRAESGMTA